MMYDFIINSLSSDGLVKIYYCSDNYHVGEDKNGILLFKFTIEESGFQTHTTLLKEKAILAKLPALMDHLTHNVSKFNSSILATTNNLKRNGSSAPEFLYQLFPAYLSYIIHFTTIFTSNKTSLRKGSS